jgi:hypothetical protein
MRQRREPPPVVGGVAQASEVARRPLPALDRGAHALRLAAPDAPLEAIDDLTRQPRVAAQVRQQGIDVRVVHCRPAERHE